jgi:hypothetical protein
VKNYIEVRAAEIQKNGRLNRTADHHNITEVLANQESVSQGRRVTTKSTHFVNDSTKERTPIPLDANTKPFGMNA